MQQCENYRPDITDFLVTEILAPQLYNHVTQNRFPLVMIPPINNPSIGEAIINMNIKNNRFYWEPIRRFNHIVAANLQPDGFLFYITPSPQPISQKSKKLHINKIRDFFNNKILGFSQPRDMEEKKMYSLLLENSSAVFFNKKEYPLAIQHLQAAERLTPDDVEVMNALGAVYAAMGLFDKAEINLKKALGIFPSHILTLQNLGQLYLDIQQYDMALPIYKKILKKDPKNLKANFGLGLCYEKIGNLDKANDLFQKVITLSPKDPLATEAREKLSHIAMH
jgi:tetratricopeptide (TPR) repeat protein